MTSTAATARPPWVLLGAITALAFALRLSAIDQSLFGDELLTYDIVGRHSLIDVLRALRAAPESTPPLHYALAWAATKVGDPTVSVRIPSVLAGTATVPVVYGLGSHLRSRTTGLLAALVAALAPFAIYYSTEARSYALVAFLVASSTLSLLHAMDDGRRRFWVMFWVVTTLALYTHYTAMFPIAFQFAWAIWRSPRRKPLLVSHVAVVVAYLPWVPFLRGNALEVIGKLDPLTPTFAVKSVFRVIFAFPYARLADVPGPLALVVGALAVALATAGAVVRFISRSGSRRDGDPRPGRPLPTAILVVGLALSTPAGLLLYFALTGTDIYAPRYLIASLPALLVLLALTLRVGPRRLVLVTTVLAVGAFTLAAVYALQPRGDRPRLRQAAAFIESRSRPGDVVLHAALPVTPNTALRRDIEIYFDKPLRVWTSFTFRSGSAILGRDGDLRAWKAARAGARVFVVGPVFGVALLPVPPPRYRLRQVDRRTYPGLEPIHVVEYERER